MRLTNRPTRPRTSSRWILATATVFIGIALLFSFTSSIAASKQRPDTFLNPPKVGDLIVPGVTSVVCFNPLDAIAMVRTGFFTTSCERLTADMALIAESVTTQDAGEGPVIMVETTFKKKQAWVPIPWHDWA